MYLQRERDFLSYIEISNNSIAKIDKFANFDTGEKELKDLVDNLFKENESLKLKIKELIK